MNHFRTRWVSTRIRKEAHHREVSLQQHRIAPHMPVTSSAGASFGASSASGACASSSTSSETSSEPQHHVWIGSAGACHKAFLLDRVAFLYGLDLCAMAPSPPEALRFWLLSTKLCSAPKQ